MWRKILAVTISILLLIPGWLGGCGLTLLAALVPLLWISSQAEDTRRGWWGCFGWALLTFVGWNLSTIMWIGKATAVGPFAATLASTFLMMLGYMTFHTISKKAKKGLAYTVLISLWITLEYLYTHNEFSWPWLLLGNGLSNDIWAIQWYEYTGLFGGSLWILLSNILLFEAWQRRSRGFAVCAAVWIVLPLTASTIRFFTYEEPCEESVIVSVVQPNIDCYDKFNGSRELQKRNIIELISKLPRNTEFILLPETAIPEYYWEESLERMPFIRELRDTLRSRFDNAMLISGANTMVAYADGEQTRTARPLTGGGYFDRYNSAIGVTKEAGYQLHHKAKLVIGVENTPSIIFKIFNFFVIDLGGVVGQIGVGDTATTFSHNGTITAPAICYEGLYGEYFSQYVRSGAKFMGIISNDGWWGDTAGHRHLYTMSAMRAVETRRSIARSANTGISGFINSRGISEESLQWEERGTITRTVWLNSRTTLYTILGDYIGRIANLMTMLSLLYYLAYRIKRRNYLD